MIFVRKCRRETLSASAGPHDLGDLDSRCGISRKGIQILEQLDHDIELLIPPECDRCTYVQARMYVANRTAPTSREQDGPDSDAAANAPSPEQPFLETEAVIKILTLRQY